MDQNSISTIEENEIALATAINQKNHVMVYLLSFALIDRLLHSKLNLSSEDNVQTCIEIFKERCRRCIPEISHLSNEFFSLLFDTLNYEKDIIKYITYYGLDKANRHLSRFSRDLNKLYLELKEWFEQIGEELNYSEVIRISKNKEYTLNTKKIIEFLNSLNFHRIYIPKFVKEKLEECNLCVSLIECKHDIENTSGIIINTITGDNAKQGIFPLHLAFALYKLVTGKETASDYSGTGFLYDSVIRQLKEFIKTNQ